MKKGLPVSTCWVVTEDLIGLRNQAIGLAQALGVDYVLKEIKKPKGLRRLFSLPKHDLTPPWPEVLISCGRQSESVSAAVRRASGNKVFTVHIQKPLDPGQFDAVIVPAHDRLRGRNVFVTLGATHHVTPEKLQQAAKHFQGLLSSLPRPVVTVLIGGKNKYQGFTDASAHDLAQKLKKAAQHAHGSLAVTFSRRTGQRNEAIMKHDLAGVPAYIWDNQGENPYFGLLSLTDAIVVTGDSMSMISEACSTGKPVYIYEMAGGGKRHREFIKSLITAGMARVFEGQVEIWKNTPLDETRKAADFVIERFQDRTRREYADTGSRNTP